MTCHATRVVVKEPVKQGQGYEKTNAKQDGHWAICQSLLIVYMEVKWIVVLFNNGTCGCAEEGSAVLRKWGVSHSSAPMYGSRSS